MNERSTPPALLLRPGSTQPPFGRSPRPRVAILVSALGMGAGLIALASPAGMTSVTGWFGKPAPMTKPAYVDDFSSIDLSQLTTAASREKFLQRANTEYCTCGDIGCPRHTLAFCMKVDSECPRARAMLIDIRDEVTPRDPAPAPAVAPAMSATDSDSTSTR